MKLKNLELLDISHNNLVSLPKKMNKMKNLKTLIIIGNEIPEKEIKKIKDALPELSLII